MSKSVIVDAGRSPVGLKNGQMVGIRPDDLAGQVVNQLLERNKSIDAKIVANIHDEVQFEVHKDDVEKIISAADLTMQKAGHILGVRLPLNADAKLGFNWAETH